MNATELKTALIRAGVTQAELAERLDRGRGMVAGWVAADHVLDEWVPLVYEALGLPVPPPPLSAFSDDDLLDELRDRLRRGRGETSQSGNDDPPDGTGVYEVRTEGKESTPEPGSGSTPPGTRRIRGRGPRRA